MQKHLWQTFATHASDCFQLFLRMRPSLRIRPSWRSPCARHTCRAHNRFSPSIVLWQHFVVSCHPLRQQRLSSSTLPEPTSSPQNDPADSPPSQSSPTPDSHTNEERTTVSVRIVKAPTPPRVKSSLKENAKKRSFFLPPNRTRTNVQDYEGVVVLPEGNSRDTPLGELPWMVPLTPELQAAPRKR